MSQAFEKPERALTILHTDDDPMNLRVVEEILSAFGHTAVAASSGEEALERLARQHFDVVLMDIHMPGMGGLEAVRRLRASLGPERRTPVVALTADVVSRRPDEYGALGFNDFVSKPILISALMASLARVTSAAAAATPRGLQRAI